MTRKDNTTPVREKAKMLIELEVDMENLPDFINAWPDTVQHLIELASCTKATLEIPEHIKTMELTTW